MSNYFVKRILAMVMAVSLLWNGSLSVSADALPDVDAEYQSSDRILDVSTSNGIGSDVSGSDVSGSDVGGPDVSGSDVIGADVSDADVSSSDVSEGDSTDESDGTEDGNIHSDMFPGLPESYVLSKQQIEEKAILAEHVDELETYSEEARISVQSEFYVDGEVLYLTDSREEAETIAAAFGATLKSYELGVAVIALSEDRTVMQAVSAAACESTRLPAVWPNYYKKLYAMPNDPALCDYNDSEEARYQWMHKFVGSFTAWDGGFYGQNVKVAVLDSGLMDAHEEFVGRNVVFWNGLTTSVEETWQDPNGHGSHVAGIVGASMNNGKGGAGIAPRCDLYVYGIANSQGSISSDAQFRAMNKAIEDGVDIMNMSFGTPCYSEQENRMIQKVYNAGIAMFAAAGNEASNSYSYPASFEHVCSVAALQEDGRKTEFSTYNDKVDLSFPGLDIWSCYNKGPDSYAYKSGTSMASPVAAGVAAVILSGQDRVSELTSKTGTDRVDALYQVMGKYAKKSGNTLCGKGYTYLPNVFKLTVDGMDVVPAAPRFSYANNYIFQDTSAFVTISSETKEGVSIYISINGKNPVYQNGAIKNGLFYDGPVEIGDSRKVVVKAIAVNEITGKCSKVSTATYYFRPGVNRIDLQASAQGTVFKRKSTFSLNAQAQPVYSESCKFVWTISPAEAGVTVNNRGVVTIGADARTDTKYSVEAAAVDLKGNPILFGGLPVKNSFAFTVCDDTKKIKKVTITSPSQPIRVNSTLLLGNSLLVVYEDGTKTDGMGLPILWSSSNTDVASIQPDGTLTVHQAGKTTIKAVINDGSKKYATYALTAQDDTKVKITCDALGLAAGKSISMKASVTPATAAKKGVTWSISPIGTIEHSGRVTVSSSGKVTADREASGWYEVVATAKDGSGAEARFRFFTGFQPVTKIDMPAAKVLFVPMEKSQAVSSAELGASIAGDNGRCRYYSSNPGVATVDEETGYVRAVAAGRTDIVCRALDGSNKSAKCKVTVKIPASSIQIVPGDWNNGMVSVGTSIKMKAIIRSNYGKPSSSKVVWSVAPDCEDIISISQSGVVKAKKLKDGDSAASFATIYAEAADGSGVKSSYGLVINPKVKSLEIRPSKTKDNYLNLWVHYADKTEDASWFHDIQVKTVRGNSVGLHKADAKNFTVVPQKPTTDKTSKNIEDYTRKDAIKVTITAKTYGSGKKTTKVVYAVRTPDDNFFLVE